MSIYSHSISWALVGKDFAKANRAITHWFNQIDLYTRNVKDGETNGVLIGPHASNLISEIILVAIDYELSRKGYKYVRNIDDYTCFVQTHEEAERFFLDLSHELKKFELSLNNKKSKIIQLPQAGVKSWVTKLNTYNFTNTYIHDGVEAIRLKELKGFLGFAVELMLEENSDAAILNYAIKSLSNKYLGNNAKDYYLKQIHHLVLLYPYLIGILESKVFEPHSVDNDTIKKIAQDLYKYGVKMKIYEACSYALYWAVKYDFDLDVVSNKTDSIDSLDCVFMLISYLHDKKHFRPLYLKDYRDIAKVLKRDDFDRNWLFVYEVLSWSDLSLNYKTMRRGGISFVKPEFR